MAIAQGAIIEPVLRLALANTQVKQTGHPFVFQPVGTGQQLID